MRTLKLGALAISLVAGATLALAGEPTKDDAVAMVKKAVAMIKADGPEKAYAEIDKGGQFHDGQLYVVVQGFDGTTLAHATNPKLIGKNMIEAQDVDGKFFAKDMAELGKKGAPFWYEYKFVNPASKKIQPKDMYCEAVAQAVVCTGVYRS